MSACVHGATTKPTPPAPAICAAVSISSGAAFLLSGDKIYVTGDFTARRVPGPYTLDFSNKAGQSVKPLGPVAGGGAHRFSWWHWWRRSSGVEWPHDPVSASLLTVCMSARELHGGAAGRQREGHPGHVSRAHSDPFFFTTAESGKGGGSSETDHEHVVWQPKPDWCGRLGIRRPSRRSQPLHSRRESAVQGAPDTGSCFSTIDWSAWSN